MRGLSGREPLIPEPRIPRSPIEVLCVDADASYLTALETALNDDGFAPVTETTAEAALGRVGDVDCVVSGYELPDETGLDLRDGVRERDSNVPFLLHPSESDAAVAEAALDGDGTGYLPRDEDSATMDRLKRRVREMVECRQTTRSLRRLLVGVEAARDGIAVAGPDDEFAFVNRVYATRLGYDPDELVGRPWRTAYAAEAVDHIESAALPSIESGWRWTGRCLERRKDGATTPTRTCIVGLDDGSLVFTAYAADDGGG